ncbi:SMC family ATPase [Streptomyces sp. C10-9-1]|uniref:AAA family ATPase n=1 Tax=Streptomyces sp. C10-9-1 TaxID=1859285 RepID=UPI0021128FD3|nr:SMC family ATPase [Streptomyces sp. C10-9-1]MCQ6555056.1 SMC family ATPase [Streptomyces sp. C10-9-1]
MRLHRLTATAFGPFATAQHVDFDTLSEAGLFLLHGQTGAGKTSVLDAVCFALYGAVPGARQSPGASLRSDHADARTPTEVRLDLTVGGRRLEITRRPAQPRPKARGTGLTTERAQSLLREYDAATATWKALSRSHQEIGEEVTRLVGMSREQFCQVVLLPQGDFARFLRADAESRAKLLGRLFDTRRFAAVEERLAELRRAAEQQVRAGDERLLALAHRMEQAAHAPRDGERALPRLRPGDPGLAGAVLAWAALARVEAREEHDAALLRAQAAESRQAGARAALDAARERARLQRRHAETAGRLEALEAARPRHEARLARVDRALRAGPVLPALRLGQDADRALAEARDGHDRARAALLPADRAAAPGTGAEPGPEAPAEREHALRRELGALESARRAERRAEEIVRERALLEREALADEEALAEASAWLAGWEALRRGHLDRIAAAQEAATRAEHLAGRLAPARERRDAARERDELTARAEQAASRLHRLHGAANEARSHWLDLKERRVLGIAAELASALAPGAPCAVCGSTDHPAPAQASAGHVDRAAEDAAYAESRRAEERRAEGERALAVLGEARAGAAARARGAAPAAPGGSRAASDGPAAAPGAPKAPEDGGAHLRTALAVPGTDDPGRAGVPGPRGAEDEPSAGELGRAVEELERALAEARRAAAASHPARAALERAEREHGERSDARHLAEQRIAARTSRREALDREQDLVDEELQRARGDAGTVAERAAQLERRLALLAAAGEEVRTLATAERQREEAAEHLDAALREAGFATAEDAREAALAPPELEELRAAVDAWRTEHAAVAERMAETDTRAAAGLAPADLPAAEAAAGRAERTLREAAERLAAARERSAALDGLSREATAEVRRLGPVRERYDRVAALAALTAGTSSDNERRMRLESYVLAARLEQVAAAATVRLQRMSSGRYTLVHSDARAGARRAGLGLHVVDAWTGRERDTATLSGGETFFASLALALGLADVVTDEAGGMRLDTLFIDEGFGSLDDQTLDEVLDVLDSLRERDRSVGIVSHVPDLRRRIPAQLEVVKARTGSAVRLRTGAPAG